MFLVMILYYAQVWDVMSENAGMYTTPNVPDHVYYICDAYLVQVQSYIACPLGVDTGT